MSLFVLFVEIVYLQYVTIHYFVVSVITIVYNIIYFITNQSRSQRWWTILKYIIDWSWCPGMFFIDFYCRVQPGVLVASHCTLGPKVVFSQTTLCVIYHVHFLQQTFVADLTGLLYIILVSSNNNNTLNSLFHLYICCQYICYWMFIKGWKLLEHFCSKRK